MRRFTMVGLCVLCLGLLGVVGASSASASGGVAAWGLNSAGQLGDGSTENSLAPFPVSGLSSVVSVAAGGEHSLALLSNGTVVAWGANAAGQLGDGNTTPSSVPVAVSGLTGVVAIAAGGEHSLALLGNGKVMSWGQNATGQLGDGGAVSSSDVPVEVSGLSEVTAIAAGGKHSLALLSDHRVKAWGADSSGQLGNGVSVADKDTPVEVSELGGVTAIAAGSLHSLALLESGTVEAWGSNGKGQLGNGTKTGSSTAVAVKGLIGVQAIAAGQTHSLALLGSGEVWAWGSGGSGELGNGAKLSSLVPVQATGLSEVSAISAGGNFSLALQTNGTLFSWGAGSDGQLGDGGKTQSAVPVANSDIHEVTAISAGGSHALAIGPQLPTVTAVSPKEGPPSGGTSVTITGTDFNGVSAVHFGVNPAAEFKVESETLIHAVAPAGSGIVNVTVTIPTGTSAGSAANTYSYAPVLSGISPTSGTQQGGTEVVIHGSNFGGTSGVGFGANPATSFKVESSTEIRAFSPAGAGTIDVTVTGPGGTSATSPADVFTYSTAPPELGRCVKVVKKGEALSGHYSDGGCTKEAPEGGKFEWKPGPGAKPTFKLKAQKGLPIEFETVSTPHKIVQCGNARGEGTYANAKSITNLTLSFSGCKAAETCKSPLVTEGNGEGKIITNNLSGHLGIITSGVEPAENLVGFAIGAPENGVFMEFSCGSLQYVWRGELIVPYRTTDKMTNKSALKFFEDKGHQNVESFEGEPKDVLTTSIGAAPYEQGAILLTLELKNKEKLELNLLH